MFRTLIAAGGVALAASSAAPRAADCNAAARDSITMLEVPGSPFQALPRPDGCWIFVSLANVQGSRGGVAVVRRGDGRVSVDHVVSVAGNPTGMQLTHDGRLLVVAAGNRLAFLDAERLVSGRGNPVLGYLDEPGMLGRIYVNVTADDRYAFVADERASTISVVDLAAAQRDRFRASAVVGKIPMGGAPISVTFSPDGKLLYTTSELAPRGLGWPLECTREGAAANDASAVSPQGAILVVDVAKATTDAAHSVIAAIGGGCSPVRLVLSPDGARVYVTARNNDALLVFDRARLLSDPGHSLLSSVHVGTAPVGIAVVDSGRAIVVTNSNRFGGKRAEDKPSLSVIDAANVGDSTKAVIGSIPCGDFPREMRVTADGRTLVLTNFQSRTIELVDLARALPRPPR